MSNPPLKIVLQRIWVLERAVDLLSGKVQDKGTTYYRLVFEEFYFALK